MRFIVHESPEDGLFYVRVTTANNQPWFTSEGYTRAADAERSVVDFAMTILRTFGGLDDGAAAAASVRAAIMRTTG